MMVSSKASSKVKLLNDDNYRLMCVTVVVLRARCALNDLCNEEVFPECTVIDLVYKFDKEPTMSV